MALAGAFIFGFTEGLAFTVMVMPEVKAIPFIPYFLRMLPYIIPLVVVIVVIGRRAFPRAIGKPYIRE